MTYKPELADERKLWIIGCGETFECIIDDLEGYGLSKELVAIHQFESVAEISNVAQSVLQQVEAARTQVFVAIDANVMNHARLEAYGRARLIGLKLMTLKHKTAYISPSAYIADNVWIGPMVSVGRMCRISSNTLIGTGARIDAMAEIGTHGWIGAGARIGRNCRISRHTSIGDGITVASGTSIGHHCTLQQPGPWKGVIPPGTCAEENARSLAMIVGRGYTFDQRGLQ